MCAQDSQDSTEGKGGYTWSGRETKKPLVLMMHGHICENLCPMQQKNKAKQKWAIEKPKLDNTRHIRGIFFIEPDDEEF